MKGFLKKLNREGVLKEVEPSRAVCESYFSKSDSNLESAKFLFEEKGKLEESIYLLYYSMYNLVLGLLYRIGVKCENHSASIYLLKEIFDLDVSKIEKAKKERVEKQYYAGSSLESSEIKGLIEDAECFSRELKSFIDEMSNSDVDFYRDKFLDLIK